MHEANEKGEEMEEMYMALAFPYEAKEGEGAEGSERPPAPWLLKQGVAMGKKEQSEAGAAGGGSEVDGSWSLEEEKKEEDNDINGEDEGKDVERKIPDKNKDLFKDIRGRP